MKRISFILSILFSVFALNAQTIDARTSIVNFEISNMGLKTVEGTFSGMQGSIQFDADNLSASSFKVCINPATVDTENEKRDAHLKNEDFFDVEKYPEICFESTSIVKTNKGYMAIGKLTMHGVTRDVQIPFTYNNKTFTGKLTVNRFDYKIGEGTNTFMVGEDAKLEIICKLR